MGSMAKYRVYLETREDGRSMAHVLALPGCFAKGPNPEATLEQVPGAVAEFLSWLRTHGETLPLWEGGPGMDVDPDEWELVEATRTDAGMESGDKVAIFGPDLLPPTDAELAAYLRLMEHSRADLLALVGKLPAKVLDRQPSGKRRTIRKVLAHVAHAEEWYLSRLYLELDLDPSEDVFAELTAVRDGAVRRLVSVPFAERSQVFVRDEYISAWGAGERWTFRKALRRFIEHEREHTANIRAILAEFGSPEEATEGGTRAT